MYNVLMYLSNRSPSPAESANQEVLSPTGTTMSVPTSAETSVTTPSTASVG